MPNLGELWNKSQAPSITVQLSLLQRKQKCPTCFQVCGTYSRNEVGRRETKVGEHRKRLGPWRSGSKLTRCYGVQEMYLQKNKCERPVSWVIPLGRSVSEPARAADPIGNGRAAIR